MNIRITLKILNDLSHPLHVREMHKVHSFAHKGKPFQGPTQPSLHRRINWSVAEGKAWKKGPSLTWEYSKPYVEPT